MYKLEFNYLLTQQSGSSTDNYWSVNVGTGPTPLVKGSTEFASWATSVVSFTCGSTAASNKLTITVKAGPGKSTIAQFDNFVALAYASAW